VYFRSATTRLEHREDWPKGFTKKLRPARYSSGYEVNETRIEAITGKGNKAGRRAKKKLALIESAEPEWKDRLETLGEFRRHEFGHGSLNVIASAAKQSILAA